MIKQGKDPDGSGGAKELGGGGEEGRMAVRIYYVKKNIFN